MNEATKRMTDLNRRLVAVADRLIDQQRARIIVRPQRPSTGHWFGGGNLVADASGTLSLVGRYRNQGDSRTGLGAGQRGLELAIFRSTDQGESFEKVVHFSKSDLDIDGRKVLSIEGSAVRLTDRGVELYVSTEKSGISYPDDVVSFLKPGTGVWTVDRLEADSIESLTDATSETVLQSSDPRFIHIKDPFLYQPADSTDERAYLMFCSHPFCWTSSNTGYVRLETDSSIQASPCFDFFPRGFTWDVAITRGTAVLQLPKVGALADRDIKLMFYDGGECVRNLEEHDAAVKRPRGYSCEELGGVAFFESGDLHQLQRLSINKPMFVSPHGTGCSRYVDVLVTDDAYYASWQQAQADGSQPLVMNRVPVAEINELLGAT